MVEVLPGSSEPASEKVVLETRQICVAVFQKLLVSHRELERLDDDEFYGLYDPSLQIRYVISSQELLN